MTRRRPSTSRRCSRAWTPAPGRCARRDHAADTVEGTRAGCRVECRARRRLGALRRRRPRQRAHATDAPVVVASKPFGESYLLCELFAQLLESRGLACRAAPRTRRHGGRVRRRPPRTRSTSTPNTRAPDCSPCCTTRSPASRRATRAPSTRTSRAASVRRWGVRWLRRSASRTRMPIAVRRATADSLRLRTLSDLARAAAATPRRAHRRFHRPPRRPAGTRAAPTDVRFARRAPARAGREVPGARDRARST